MIKTLKDRRRKTNCAEKWTLWNLILNRIWHFRQRVYFYFLFFLVCLFVCVFMCMCECECVCGRVCVYFVLFCLFLVVFSLCFFLNVLYRFLFQFLIFILYEQSSWLFRTQRATFRLNSGYDSLHSLAASTLAGDSSFGSASIDITDIKIVSTVCTGNQRSDAFSYPHLSSPGSCKILMQTSPFFSIFGCHISVTNFMRGGLSGYSFGKCKCALKKPPSLYHCRCDASQQTSWN